MSPAVESHRGASPSPLQKGVLQGRTVRHWLDGLRLLCCDLCVFELIRSTGAPGGGDSEDGETFQYTIAR